VNPVAIDFACEIKFNGFSSQVLHYEKSVRQRDGYEAGMRFKTNNILYINPSGVFQLSFLFCAR
jgi:hypothetical protein